MSGPRVLAIMGSGEIAPTMAKVHRALFERFGDRAATTAALIDTPYGFQENADELTARIVDFFRLSVGRAMTVATYRSAAADAVESATAVARIGEAGYVLAGPGSPSYALAQWAGGPVPGAIGHKLADGGIVTMASAAALTLGVATIPVYEIYKVGADPTWLDGLDLLGQATGLRSAVVPHYDNAEGGTHDTRFCYMGERRLRVLERSLPSDVFVLGVDSHTALVLDLEARTADVFGLGGVTIRVDGRSRTFPNGSETTIDALAETADDLRTSGHPATAWIPTARSGRRSGPGPDRPAADQAPAGSLRDHVSRIEGAFVDALAERDVHAAVSAILELDETIERRVGAGDDSPDLHAAQATLRSFVVRLGDVAVDGTRDPREIVAPFVEALLEVRARARDAQDWATADLVRDRLAEAGVEVQDGTDASTWSLGSS